MSKALFEIKTHREYSHAINLNFSLLLDSVQAWAIGLEHSEPRGDIFPISYVNNIIISQSCILLSNRITNLGFGDYTILDNSQERSEVGSCMADGLPMRLDHSCDLFTKSQ